MKPKRKLLLTAFILCTTLPSSKVIAQTNYITQQESVTDTATVRRLISEAKQNIVLRKKDLEQQITKLELIKPDLEYFSTNINKKVETQSQMDLLLEAYENYESSLSNVKKISKKVLKGIIVPELEKEASKMATTLYNNIKTYNELIRITEEENSKFEDFFNRSHNVSGVLQGLDKNFKPFTFDTNVKKYIDVIVGSTDKTENYIVVDGKRIPNQNSWLWQFFNDHDTWSSDLDKEMTNGWEWAKDNSNLETVSRSYPIMVRYLASTAHPEYAIVDDVVYTKEGKLVRVLECRNADTREIKKYLYRKDYADNKYNIKEKSAETQNHIKRQLGYKTTQTAKEKARDAKAAKTYKDIRKADRARKTANTRQEYYKANQAYKKASLGSLAIMDALFDFDSDGMSYIQQLENDHENDCKHVYSYRRIDNTSFEIKYTGQEKGYTAKVTYTQDKPFKVKETTTVVSEDEAMNIDDFKGGSKHTNINMQTTSVEEGIYDVVEEMPSFPGGQAELMSYISKNIKYPVEAQTNKIQGRVICTFVVERNGSISNINIIKSVDSSIDNEAIRIIKSMPLWIPGKNKGEAVRVKYSLPIIFRLS